jgi:hypothetical protein
LGFLYHRLEITKSIYQILQFFASEFDISKVVFSTSLQVADQSSPRLYLASRRLGPCSLGSACASPHRGTAVAAPAMPSRAWEGRTATGAVRADRAGEACAPTTALLAHTGEGHVAAHDVHTHTGEGTQLRPLCSCHWCRAARARRGGARTHRRFARPSAGGARHCYHFAHPHREGPHCWRRLNLFDVFCILHARSRIQGVTEKRRGGLQPTIVRAFWSKLEKTDKSTMEPFDENLT